MRRHILFLMLVLSGAVLQGGIHTDDKSSPIAHLDFDLKNGTLTVCESDDPSHYIKITENFELFVQKQEVELNAYQKSIVREYYEEYKGIEERGKELGLMGGKLGIEGASIGLYAVLRLPKMLLPNYDSDDFERDIENRTDDLEDKAKDVERAAKKLERRVRFLEDYQLKMKKDIPELYRLSWF